MSGKVCVHCYIGGKVQGVWFRASAKQAADKLGITGWAKNLPDGRVEVMACGDERQIKEFCEWLKKGPKLAAVDSLQVEREAWQAYAAFEVR